MSNDKTLEELQEERARIVTAINKIEDEKRAAKAKSYIGKCYKFRNSFGGNSVKWWLYVKVISSKGPNMRVLRFQSYKQDYSHKVADIDFVDEWARAFSGAEYIEISEKEFNKALANIIADVKSIPSEL